MLRPNTNSRPSINLKTGTVTAQHSTVEYKCSASVLIAAKEFDLENTEEPNIVPQEEFFIAVGRYEPDWLGSYVSNVINYGIDKQGQLPSGKVQVTFSTLEQHPDQDADDDSTYGYRFVCIVAFDKAKKRWVIEDHQEPIQI